MDSTTNDAIGKSGPDRWCAACEAALDGEADVFDGELMCGACGAGLRRAQAQEELDEAIADRAEVEGELDDRRDQYRQDEAELERDFARDMSDLRRRLADWDRRIAGASRRLASLPVPEPSATPQPIVGGAPFEPTAEDWADYHAWSEAADREIEGDGPEDPIWGYE